MKEKFKWWDCKAKLRRTEAKTWVISLCQGYSNSMDALWSLKKAS